MKECAENFQLSMYDTRSRSKELAEMLHRLVCAAADFE